jgi:hypothetical protein
MISQERLDVTMKLLLFPVRSANTFRRRVRLFAKILLTRPEVEK